MAELMLVNPRKRRKGRRTAAQKAATRKLIAYNRRKKNPSRPVTRRRKVVARRRPAAPVRYKRRYKRNPSNRGIMNSTVIPAAVAGAGALTLDILWGFVPLPAALKTGVLSHAAKGAGAIGLGYLAGMVTNKRTAGQLASGALTVVFHDIYRELATKFMPNLGMGEYTAGMGYYSAGQPVGMGEYTAGMGEYADGNIDPYLSQGNLSSPFNGPSAPQVAYDAGSRAAAENAMAGYYY